MRGMSPEASATGRANLEATVPRLYANGPRRFDGFSRGDGRSGRRVEPYSRATPRPLRCRENRATGPIFTPSARGASRIARPDKATDPWITSLVCSSKQADPYGELKIFAGTCQPGPGPRPICQTRSAPSPCPVRDPYLFSDGNIFVRVLENVRGRDVYIVQGTEYPGQRQPRRTPASGSTPSRGPAPPRSRPSSRSSPTPRGTRRTSRASRSVPAWWPTRSSRPVPTASSRWTSTLLRFKGFFKIPVDHLYAMPILADYFKQEADPGSRGGQPRCRVRQAGISLRRDDAVPPS